MYLEIGGGLVSVNTDYYRLCIRPWDEGSSEYSIHCLAEGLLEADTHGRQYLMIGNDSKEKIEDLFHRSHKAMADGEGIYFVSGVSE